MEVHCGMPADSPKMQLGTVLPLSNSLTALLASFGNSFVYTVICRAWLHTKLVRTFLASPY